ncbi:UNVERIFIED_CONTAM: Transposon TX1 uncharacterized protein [Sesamum indicum]
MSCILNRFCYLNGNGLLTMPLLEIVFGLLGMIIYWIHILDMGEQFIQCYITIKALHESCIITIAYGASEVIDRRTLWHTLGTLAQQCSNDPWLVGGDFNAVRDLNEVCGISGDIRIATEDFNNGIQEAGLLPLPMQGEWYTWHNCSTTTRSLWKRLDRILINDRWLERFPTSSYHSLLPRTSDHSLLVLHGDSLQHNGGMFRFDNYLTKSPDFIPSVQNIWQHEVIGVPMYAVTRKLKALKQVFRQQRRNKGDLTRNVQLAKGFLDEAQTLVSSDRQNELFLYLEHWEVVGLDWFAELSGLRLNVQKSHLIISRSAQNLKDQMLDILGFQEGHLPMRYLGLPLISSRLTISDCQPLISKIDARINGWEGISLSYAGRVQIIKSVLSALSLYWASAFILPKKVINEIEKRLRTFLWKGTTSSGYAKVAWKDVCRPIDEGGLGFKDISTLNRALMSKKLCDVIQCDRTSIWVQWLYQDRLCERSIWTIREHGGSWGWRKILRLRPFLRAIVDYQIGNGDRFFVWQDPWHHLGPLIERFPQGPRHLRLEESAKLSLVISAGEWQWPTITDFECLEITHNLPLIFGGEDRVVWRCDEGQPTTQALYRLFTHPEPKVGWSSLLLGSLKIPRHSFILWLAILGKLPTTDKSWLSHLGVCILCDEGATESHPHLFFQCRFSRQCLYEIRRRIRFHWPNRDWATDIEWATRKWRGKHIINRAYCTLLAACVYHIWKERNLRRFDHTERTPATLSILIINDVRQRILSVDLASSVGIRALYRLWRIPWNLLGGNRRRTLVDINYLRPWARHILSDEEASHLLAPFSPEEVKLAVFDIAEDKARALMATRQDSISPCQAAFIPGRSIGDNIMLAQELFMGYNQARLPPRCALKVDIRKAYDTVEWDFLVATLQLFGFPPTFTRWIEECILTTSFSVGLNGTPHGFFAGARGLRQGDPLSPFLFVLVMEVLHIGYMQLIEQDMQFKYHWKCEPARVFQLGFADDLLLFCRADLDSVRVLKVGLDRFAEWSGLRLNIQKSHIIISRSAQERKDQLLSISGFQEGHLPMRYLGLPLLD